MKFILSSLPWSRIVSHIALLKLAHACRLVSDSSIIWQDRRVWQVFADSIARCGVLEQFRSCSRIWDVDRTGASLIITQGGIS